MISEVSYLENVNAKYLSTYKGGGCVKYVVFPKTISMIRKVITYSKNEGIPFFILGNGSNLLIGDKGYNGIFISTKYIDKVSIYNNMIYSSAGTKVCKLFNLAYENSLTGLEKLALIPATIGGMVVSNAGCFGEEISDIIVDVDLLNLDTLEVERKSKNDIKFDYRYSSIKDKYLVLGVRLKLEKLNKDKILETYNQCKTYRKNTQPSSPSLGSTFKRDNFIPAKLIDSLGLKGFRIGGAMVSNKHANFIVNVGNGTATDYIRVMEKVESRVLSEFKVNLTREIVIL